MEVVASLSQGRTAAVQCGLFTHKSVPVIFEPPCNCRLVKFRKDVCIANTDVCELWTNLWIMKFMVFTAVLLKTNLQVCVLFNEKWEDYLVSNGTT